MLRNALQWANGKTPMEAETALEAGTYPACRRRNMIASGKVFKTLNEKRDYIKTGLKKRGDWNTAEEMSELRESIQSKETVAEILQSIVPVGKMGWQPSARKYRKRQPNTSVNFELMYGQCKLPESISRKRQPAESGEGESK